MKILSTFIVSLFLCIPALGQHNDDYGQKIISFVDKNMGKKVKHGICFDLVHAAHGDNRAFIEKWCTKRKYKVKDPKPGDSIEFEDVIYYNNKGSRCVAISHIGIVYKNLGDGNLIMAEQNVGVKRGNPSKVILSQSFNYKKISCGKIKFYRFD